MSIKERIQLQKTKQIDYSIGIATVLLLIVLICTNEQYLNINNYMNLLRETTFLAIPALGMLCVIITRNIDMSIATMLALIAVVGFKLMPVIGVAPAIIVMLLVGVVCGAINGVLVVFTRIEAFIVTLGMQYLYKGIAYVISKQETFQVPEGCEFYTQISNTSLFANGNFSGIPFVFIIFLAVAVVMYIMMHRAGFGRKVFATGNSTEAAYLVGIKVEKVKMMTYMILGLLMAITAILISSRYASCNASIKEGFEFDIIIVVVMGGCIFNSGRGSVLNTCIAAFFYALLSNLMNQFNVGAFLQYVIKAILLLIAFSLTAVRAYISTLLMRHRGKRENRLTVSTQ